MKLFYWLYSCFFASLIFGIDHMRNVLSEPEQSGEQYYSMSTPGLVSLLELEFKFISNMNDYANALEQKLQVLRSALNAMDVERAKAQLDKMQYVSNPINSFSLIRRLHRDWKKWQVYMEQPLGKEQMAFFEQHRHNLPTDKDMSAVADAIHRIQTTYFLEASDMASGLLNGKQYNTSWNALDIYTVGKNLYNTGKYKDAIKWLIEAIEWLKRHQLPAPLGLQMTTVQLDYAQSLIQLEQYSDALELLQSLHIDESSDPEMLGLKNKTDEIIRNLYQLVSTSPNTINNNSTTSSPSSYLLGCRGKFPAHPKLYCKYNKTTTPFLRLAPLKMEVLSLDPYMTLYHDVISLREATEIKELATPILRPTTVDRNGSNVVSKVRTAKGVWFADDYKEVIQRINERIADMTGFNLTNSEKIQVISYGVGGHYGVHGDYFEGQADSNLLHDNRIATVLFYLNDVEQGGATVFPRIKRHVLPRLGDALLWYNLLPSGEPDLRTRHAACPVIVGSKWIFTKWIRVKEQFRIRPCHRD
ncbi:prolyl 4-hydroxylase subunit alpha-2-like [Scaptodrosophila lebanonensis]|uniref:procollagen-proline 4-dioxygenase n=1 Tax=Drosophila lebanonensis TaxID=7225 RepID=A0A6J2T2C0_DROLE|nr:prolyl 4-hydroxylase subunit alpha-2-like [Scaptodrosophila lebanonensis]